jgi:hypothetical protein
MNAWFAVAMDTRPLPIYAWFGLEPPPARRCSRGCHLLPATAQFDPHNGLRFDGADLDVALDRRQARQLGLGRPAFS